ncbi:hypothetical protein DUNSADRAFT_4012 [Dunaliella salina]|uniref:Encoded protein n=1 Tax=Dunaliella salina TaxID=3046 RepID=A0ABQ7GSW3_DUNSA|nr:hypothetical protein DUNSADRAFT_4012 [Dunaliella salina]|eukprot:KAF5837702.1 hypothetical protein DUNSADRAFT_4012 [Dunaliella salina]
MPTMRRDVQHSVDPHAQLQKACHQCSWSLHPLLLLRYLLLLIQKKDFPKLVVALLVLAWPATAGQGSIGMRKVDWKAAVQNGKQHLYFMLHLHAPKTAGSTFHMHSVKSIPFLRHCQHIPTAFLQPINTMGALQSNLNAAIGNSSCNFVTPFKNAFSTFAPCNYTLAKAKHELTAHTFFIGLAGPFYAASLCLLDYQLGLFDHGKCGDLCAPESQRHPNINSLPSQVAVESMYSVHELKWLASANEMDSILFAFAQQLVLKRIRYAETETRARLLCF